VSRFLTRERPQTALLADPDCRMQIFLSRFQKFPVNLLFGNRLRLDEDGLRWMPTSFLQLGMEVKAVSRNIAYRHRLGLVAELPGILLFPLEESCDIQGRNI